MARCGCAGASCSCVVTGAGGISVVGAGSQTNPYVVSGGGVIQAQDTGTIDLSLVGVGSATEPYVLSADAIIELNELTDVDTAGATTGQVLARQSDGTYRFVAPVTASPGSITVGQDLQGDGSGGNPLRAKIVSGGGLTTSASGLAVAGFGVWSAFTPTWTASTTNPALGNGSLTGRSTLMGKTRHFSIRLTFGTTTTRGVGQYRFALPSQPAAPSVFAAEVITNGGGNYVGVAASDGALARIDAVLLATATRGENLTHAVPSSFGPGGGVVWISGSYEEA